MSDTADNFETLSNVELHEKLKESGLPNTPVTDSSRNVIIKRLRASLSGSPLKKGNRRETIAVPKVVEEPATKNKVSGDDAADARPSSRNRRTLGVVSNDELPASQANAENPAPIAARRRSVREKAFIKTTTIVDDQPIIIEDDDEDDNELVQAVENAEKFNVQAKKTTVRGARAGSLGKSAVQVTSYRQTVTPIIEQVTSETEISSSNEVPNTSSRNTVESRYPGLTSAMQQPPRSTLGYEPSTRYTTSYTSRYSGTQSAGNYYSPIRNAPQAAAAATLYNEHSDGNEDAKDGIESPFLSNFARNLERLKTDSVALRSPYTPMGAGSAGISQRYKRNAVHERHGREKSLKQSCEDVLFALDEKYGLRRNLLILAVLIVAVIIYVIFFA